MDNLLLLDMGLPEEVQPALQSMSRSAILSMSRSAKQCKNRSVTMSTGNYVRLFRTECAQQNTIPSAKMLMKKNATLSRKLLMRNNVKLSTSRSVQPLASPNAPQSTSKSVKLCKTRSAPLSTRNSATLLMSESAQLFMTSLLRWIVQVAMNRSVRQLMRRFVRQSVIKNAQLSKTVSVPSHTLPSAPPFKR